MRVLSLIVLCAVGCASRPSRPAVDASGAEGCQTPLGFIPNGQTATGYLHSVESQGQSCQQGTLSCEDGNWSGAYIYPACVLMGPTGS